MNCVIIEVFSNHNYKVNSGAHLHFSTSKHKNNGTIQWFGVSAKSIQHWRYKIFFQKRDRCLTFDMECCGCHFGFSINTNLVYDHQLIIQAQIDIQLICKYNDFLYRAQLLHTKVEVITIPKYQHKDKSPLHPLFYI